MVNSIVNKPLLLFTILCSAFYYLFGCAAPSPKVTGELRQYSVTIGTGGVTGVYYPTGGAICKIINSKRKIHGIHCGVESTGGSVYNINVVMAGDLEFGMTQSDRQYQAFMGIANWRHKGPQKDLRAVFSIYPESVGLIAAVDANINSLQDLKGKRVNIGNVGSGYRKNAIDALVANGLDFNKDFYAKSLKAAEGPGMIQDGRLDAAFYTVGHPSGYYKEATSGKRKVKFVPITNIESLLEKYPYYAKAKIPVNMYPKAKNRKNVDTFGVKCTFVTSAKVPDEVVYTITREIFENFSKFKKLHPAYQLVTKKSMLEGLSAPIHPGALRYYEEVGLK
jgi:TRAP transporter TAXI family solute receptor